MDRISIVPTRLKLWKKFQAHTENRILRLTNCLRYPLNATTMSEFTTIELVQILHACAEIMLEEPMLLELNIPPDGLYVVGDLNADINQLYDIFHAFGLPPDTVYLFLGDYIGGDEEEYQIEVILLLVLLKIRWPDKIFLLRGHKETYEYVIQHERFNEIVKNDQLFFAFNMLFDVMPIVAIIGEHYLCCHSGVSQYMASRHDIMMIKRPTYRKNMPILGALLFTDILHGCPDPTLKDQSPFAASTFKPMGYRFNQTGLQMVLKALGGLNCLIRSHTFVTDGLSDDFQNGTCFTFNSKEFVDNACKRCSREAEQARITNSSKYCFFLKEGESAKAVELPAGTKTVGLKYNPLQEKIFEKFNSPFEYEDHILNIHECLICYIRIPWNMFTKRRCITHPDLYEWILENFGLSVLEQNWQRSRQLRWYRSAQLFPILYDRKFRPNQNIIYVPRFSGEYIPVKRAYTISLSDERKEKGIKRASVELCIDNGNERGVAKKRLPLSGSYELSDNYNVLPSNEAPIFHQLIHQENQRDVAAMTQRAQLASSFSREKPN